MAQDDSNVEGNDNINSAPDNATVEGNTIPLSDENAKNEKRQSILLNNYKFSMSQNLYHQNSNNFSDFNIKMVNSKVMNQNGMRKVIRNGQMNSKILCFYHQFISKFH